MASPVAAVALHGLRGNRRRGGAIPGEVAFAITDVASTIIFALAFAFALPDRVQRCVRGARLTVVVLVLLLLLLPFCHGVEAHGVVAVLLRLDLQRPELHPVAPVDVLDKRLVHVDLDLLPFFSNELLLVQTGAADELLGVDVHAGE